MAERKKCEHVAIILDGNGRWAKAQGKPRTYGHSVGADNIEIISRAADELGIKYLTVYAFSTENWKRPKAEVNTIMRLLGEYVDKCVGLARENNMKVRFIGDISGLSDSLQGKIDRLITSSAGYTGLTLTLAINYGGRHEILRAMKRMAESGADISGISEADFESYLDTAGLPDPDLLIRTGGDKRISNFLLWQLCYTEFMFIDVAWPAFSKQDLADCLDVYYGRERRFGGL